MKQLNWYQIFGNTHIIPDGKTVTPTDDIQTLLHCANIWDKSYTTLAEVLADDDTLFLICISDNAIDYLVRSTTWASNAALAPTMTSNTTPSGVVSASSVYENRPQDQPYHAFDGSDSAAWSPATGRSSNYLQYKFDESHIFSAFSIKTSNRYTDEARIDTLTVSIGETEETLTTVYSYNPNQTVIDKSDSFTPTSGKVCRVTFYQSQGYKYCSVPFLQFYSEGIVSSESAMQYIGASDYASETLLSDSTWNTAISDSVYRDYVINVKVPTMTSNTTPSGVCSASSNYSSSYPAYLVFDRIEYTSGNNNRWVSASGSVTNQYVQYAFPESVKVKYVRIKQSNTSGSGTPKDMSIRVSNDGNTFTSIETFSNTDVTFDRIVNISDDSSYRYWRLFVSNAVQTSPAYIQLTSLDFYGRENAGVQSWLKAGGITNKKYTTVSEVLSDLTTLATLMSSSDAIDYLVTAKGWATEICSDSNAMADIGMNNYAANTLLADETWAEAIGNSTYFTSVLNVSVPAMTDNTHPYGECFASDVNSVAWKAFNGTNTGVSDMWGSDNAVPQSLGYKFTSPVRIAKVMIANRKGASPGYIHSVRDFALEGSNDGVAYTKIKDFLNTNNTQGAETYYSNAIGTTCTYYHINISSTNEGNTPYIGMLQFYGRKDI